MSQRKAFTLIELLVVLAVIGLLAALIFPVFAKAREKGRQASCLSNERQLGMAMLQYAGDNEDTFPSAGSVPADGGQWIYQSYPYVKNAQVFRCPNDSTDNPVPPSPLRPTRYVVDSYGLNLNLTGYKPAHGQPAHLSALAAPAKTVALFEVVYNTAALLPPIAPQSSCAATGDGGTDEQSASGSWAFGCTPLIPPNTFGYETQYATGSIGGREQLYSDPRHNGGANFAACDGHVKWLRPEQVSGGQSATAAGDAQDDKHAAGTGDGKYALTFSIR